MPSRRIVAKTVTPETGDLPPGMPPGADPEAWRLMVTQGAAVVEHDDPEETAELDLADQLRAVFGADPGDGARISIYKRDARTKAREWCGDYTPEQFIAGGLALVKQDFGAGQFEFRAYGRTGLLTRGAFAIAVALAPAAQSVGAGSELARVLEQQTAMIAALAARFEKPEPSMHDKLQEWKMMRDVFAPASATVAPPQKSMVETLTEMVAVQRMLKSISEENAPPAADPDNPLSFLGPILDVAKAAIQRSPAVPETVAPVQLPASLAASNPALPAPPAEVAASQSPDALAWRGMVAELERMAREKVSAEQGGELLYQTLPDEFLPYLKLPTWFEILIGYAPELAPHREWIMAAKADADRRFAESDAAG